MGDLRSLGTEPANREDSVAETNSRTARSPWPLVDRLAGELGYKYGLVLVWAAVIVIFSVLRPATFATRSNAETILGSQAVLVIVTLGLILALTVGKFDLSLGGVLGFSATTIAVLNVRYAWPVGAAVAVALLGGLVIGAVNGFFVVIVGIDAFIGTLGMGTFITGLAAGMTNFEIVGGVSERLVGFVSNRVLGIPVSFYYGIILAALVWYVLRYTPTGRHMVFIGQGREVARLSGLRVRRIEFGAFVFAGLFGALAGMALVGTLGGADPVLGNSYILPMFAAAFLGSTAISPGFFNPWGSVIAAYFLVTGVTGLELLGISTWIEQIFYGAALIFAVTLSKVATKRREERS
jgi:ribose transport system permease protein